MINNLKRAKIVATLGPSSNSASVIKSLIKSGMNVCRVNMSHGDHESHKELIKNIRWASGELEIDVGILVDLQGPKIRVDKLENNIPLVLKNDEEWFIGTSNQNEFSEIDNFIPTTYEKLTADCEVGERILFDDGLIIGSIIGKEGKLIKIRVSVGGELKSNKGINLPDTNVTAESFTKKDREDLDFALTQDIDFIALSFVRFKKDIVEVKDYMKERGYSYPVISKIEKPQALDNFDEILEVTDGVMVARGDMGVEVGNHIVPRVQKELIAKCNNKGTPVITATQMLDSMINHPTPTRAEASDVANAVWDGSDALMLSGESASGEYPLETVQMMNKIILEAEKNPKPRPLLRDITIATVSETMMVAASMIAENVKAKKIIVITNTGDFTKMIARFRPTQDVVGVTNSISAVRKMSLYWGIRPIYIAGGRHKKADISDILEIVKEEYDLEEGDRVVVVNRDGDLFALKASNFVKVEII